MLPPSSDTLTLTSHLQVLAPPHAPSSSQAMKEAGDIGHAELMCALDQYEYLGVLWANTVPMVDSSRSAKVFASFQTNIDQTIPSDAPGWIVARYEALTNACNAPTGAAVTPEVAPAAPAARGSRDSRREQVSETARRAPG